MTQTVLIYCTGRPDNDGRPTHDRWDVTEMVRGEHGWFPRTVRGRGREYAGQVITELSGDTPLLSDDEREKLLEEGRSAEYLAELEKRVGPDFRVHYSLSCRVPLHRQRRGCGLNVPIRSSRRVDRLLDGLAAAGVSELSLIALAVRISCDT